MSRPDPRLVFLARCGARHCLVEAGEMELGEAIAGLLEGAYCPLCGADLLVELWERTHPPLKDRRRWGAR
jgi:hypothetical protein